MEEVVSSKVSEALKRERDEHDRVMKDFDECRRRLEAISIAKRNDEDTIVDLNHKIEKYREDINFYSKNSSYQALMQKLEGVYVQMDEKQLIIDRLNS